MVRGHSRAQARGESATIHVGCSGFGPRRPARQYFKRLSAVELEQSFFYPPRQSTLTRLRREAPAGFAFVVRAWQLVTHEPGSPSYKQLPPSYNESVVGAGHFRDTEPVQRGLNRSQEVADLLDAAALLFESPPSFTPSAENRRALSRFFERCPRSGRAMVWNPLGLWSAEQATDICRDLQLVPCWDPFVDSDNGVPPPDLDGGVYLRPRGLGGAQSYGQMQLEWLVDRLADQLPDQLEQQPRLALCLFASDLLFGDAERLQALVR